MPLHYALLSIVIAVSSYLRNAIKSWSGKRAADSIDSGSRPRQIPARIGGGNSPVRWLSASRNEGIRRTKNLLDVFRSIDQGQTNACSSRSRILVRCLTLAVTFTRRSLATVAVRALAQIYCKSGAATHALEPHNVRMAALFQVPQPASTKIKGNARESQPIQFGAVAAAAFFLFST